MKSLLALCLVSFVTAAFAQDFETQSTQGQIVNAETIDVSGTLREKPATDHELESIKAEITKQKQETALNKKKAKSFQELSKSVEGLSQTTEEYILEKKAAQMQIAEYNEKVRCMQEEYPGRECEKYLKNKK